MFMRIGQEFIGNEPEIEHDIDRQCDAVPFNMIRDIVHDMQPLHHLGELGYVVLKIDLREVVLFLIKHLMHDGNRFNTPLRQMELCRGVPVVAPGLKIDNGRDDVEIVFDTVMYLFEQDLFFGIGILLV